MRGWDDGGNGGYQSKRSRGKGGAFQQREANPTGPTLGPWSELKKLADLPYKLSHRDRITGSCLVGADEIFTTGGPQCHRLRSFRVIPQPTPQGLRFRLDQDKDIDMGTFISAMTFESPWLVVGLGNGALKAFNQDSKAEHPALNVVHTGQVNALVLKEVNGAACLLSAAEDGTFAIHTFRDGAFAQATQASLATMGGASGPIKALQVLGTSLWLGAKTGVSVIDLQTLTVKGTVPVNPELRDMVTYEEGGVPFCILALVNGGILILDSAGNPVFQRGPAGDHTSNTSISLVFHHVDQKFMLICGQDYGYCTAYDLPAFTPRGSFRVHEGSNITHLKEIRPGGQPQGLFVVGGATGDVSLWQFGHPPDDSRH